MKATKCTANDLQMALDRVNEKYDSNIRFNPDSDLPERFTLRVNGKGKGSAYSQAYVMGLEWAKKRRTGSACWHVHGHFFEELLKVNPEAVIKSASGTIDINGGNWIDRNIGSIYSPLYYSEACDCYSELVPKGEKDETV